MSNDQHRAEFSEFILLPAGESNTELSAALIEAGYQTSLLQSQAAVIERLKAQPPHILVFSSEALATPLSEFVEQVLTLNPEVQFVCIAPVSQSETLLEYREYNFSELVPTGAQLPSRVLWATDRVSETLYLTYQNESLLQKNQELGEIKDKYNSEKESPISEKIEFYSACATKDEVVLAFFRRLHCKAIFFKYLPTVNSFVALSAQGVDVEDIKGVGSRLEPSESRDLPQHLREGVLPQALTQILKEGLHVSRFVWKPLLVQDWVEGILVFWGDEKFEFSKIENEFLIFDLIYQKMHLQKKTDSLDFHDPVTELFNRNYYFRKLDEEMARARRLEKPVSLVKIAIDHLPEIEQSFGTHNRDLILRSIATLAQKTSRVNDITCRTNDNEITLILPHCARKGAALRAERLRRIVENHSFALNDMRITLSSGVSEYPSLSADAAGLDQSTQQALDFIVSRGGNKVCLYKPAQAIVPDFEVPL
jgi:diguanylate cyclase (GGDEF)-like protein